MYRMSEKIPSPLILKSMRPEEGENNRLISPEIDDRVEEYGRYESDAWNQFLDAQEGSVDEESLARKLAKIYLLKTSQKLSSPESYRRSVDRETWAQRFTESSSELYPRPELPFVESIVRDEVQTFAEHEGSYVDEINGFYASLSEKLPPETSMESADLERLTERQVAELAGAFFEAHGDWFDYIDTLDKQTYAPPELTNLFNKLIKIRSESDPAWQGWHAELIKDKDTVSVVGSKKVILVGAERTEMTRDEVLGLVAHELGVHAQRSVNGHKKSKALGGGYAGYIDVEESLGILAERFVTGHLPDKAKDRYLDIALAMGTIPGVQMSRVELIELATNRSLARRQISGEIIDEETIESETKKAKTHINRIFRGGDGLSGEKQAVFTKDSIYYPAILEDYLAGAVGEKTPREVIDFLLQGKFDPTNPSHLRKLEEV